MVALVLGKLTPGRLALDRGTETTRLGCGEAAMFEVCDKLELLLLLLLLLIVALCADCGGCC